MCRSYEAGGLRLRVGRYGEGRPLLLITGIGAHLEMWAPLARYASGLELIGFDPPGAGMSQRPRLPMRMSGLAAVVERLMDESGLDRVDVLGYSWGGGLAQELARRAPDRVGRLVLCATGPGLGGTPAASAGRADARHAGALLPPAAARPERPVHRRRADGDASAARWQPRRPTGCGGHPTCSATRFSCTRSPGGRACRGCTVCASRRWWSPANEDPSVPLGNARLLAARIPNARLHVVKGGGHLFLLDEPENVTPTILDFLAAPDRSVIDSQTIGRMFDSRGG